MHVVRMQRFISCIYLIDKERLYVSPSTVAE